VKRLLIFEGPDGVGKTTLAKALAEHIDAAYVHHGSYPEIDNEDLANCYAVSIAPAALGVRDVVMDRSWLSEKPYGLVFRNGRDRLGSKFDALEGFAAQTTQALVIRCDADWQRCSMNFEQRRSHEYLDDAVQLFKVWRWYRESFKTSLASLVIHPFLMTQETAIERILECA
jgi:hypothetical protein